MYLGGRAVWLILAVSYTGCANEVANDTGGGGTEVEVALLQTRVTTLENELATLQGQLAGLEASLADMGEPGAVNDVANPVAWSQLKDVPDYVLPPPIVCEFENAGQGQSVGSNTHSWTAGECGGTLPDERYVGTVSRVQVCGGAVTFVAAGDPSPEMSWFNGSPCVGVNLRAVYVAY